MLERMQARGIEAIDRQRDDGTFRSARRTDRPAAAELGKAALDQHTLR